MSAQHGLEKSRSYWSSN